MAELRSTFETESLFYFTFFFDKKHSKTPRKYLWNRLFKFPKILIFLWSYFKNWDFSLSPKKEMRVWYCVGFFSIYFTQLRLLICIHIIKSCVSHGVRPDTILGLISIRLLDAVHHNNINEKCVLFSFKN